VIGNNLLFNVRRDIHSMALGMQELLIVLFLVLLLFGAKKLPELAHSIGEALNEFKKTQKPQEK
jgi:sec-independent protein translocase protein TatA